jgi:hypothetical protein
VYYALRTLLGALCLDVYLFAFLLGWIGAYDNNKYASFYGGIVWAISCIIRFQILIFTPALLGIFLWKKKFKALSVFLLGFLLIVLLHGGLDLITWGSFFKSPIEYANFNIVENGGAIWGTSPWHFYVVRLWEEFRPISLICIAILILGGINSPFLAFSLLIYLIAASLGPHKELRFMAPIIPLLLILMGMGINKTGGFFKTPTLRKNILALLTFSLIAISIRRSTELNWNGNTDVINSVIFTGRQDDCQAVTTLGTYWWNTGGYFYLHRDVPFESFGYRSEYERYKPSARTKENLLKNAIGTAQTPRELMGHPGYHFNLSQIDSQRTNYLIVAKGMVDRHVKRYLKQRGFYKIKEYGDSLIYKKRQ